MFARKVKVEVLTSEGSRPCPISWLDSFCMRGFTGRTVFDETLPIAEGEMEVSFQVDLESLRADMEEWMTRKSGDGRQVRLRLTVR